MNEKALEEVYKELAPALTGRRMGAIFPLSRFETVIDFRIESGHFLFISVEPADPRIYLVRRKMKELAKASLPLSPFHSLLRKHLTGSEVTSLSKLPGERVFQFQFSGVTEGGSLSRFDLIIQLTGRSANIFLLDQERRVIDSFRQSEAEGQQVGDLYALPSRRSTRKPDSGHDSFELPENVSISEFLDSQSIENERRRSFDRRAAAERHKLSQQIAKRQKLIDHLKGDLDHHGDAEKWKRFGDLLLANASMARVLGSKVIVQDLFAEHSPEIEIEVKENESITEAAERFYKLYTKARNASVEIAKRLNDVRRELEELQMKKEVLDDAIAAGDESFLESPEALTSTKKGRRKAEPGFIGARRFVSSDGIEILVGKKATDNDFLTFRLARSLDFWFHAADYPGSHVVARNPDRRSDLPAKTLLESAQLAAFYSSGKSQVKAAVNYTQKKFVNKPRGGAPGLATLSKFKTLLVEPIFPPAVTKKD